MIDFPAAPLASTLVATGFALPAVLLVALLPALCAIGVSVAGGVRPHGAIASPAPRPAHALADGATFVAPAGVVAGMAATIEPWRSAPACAGQEATWP
jgi:hypothetical protein